MGGAATPGDGPDDGSDDPFASLLDPDFAERAAVKEPSAEERAKAAARAEREAALRRRLAEEAEHEARLAERDRKATRAAARLAEPPRRRSRWITPVVVVALVGVLLWVQNGRSSSPSSVASGGEAAPGTAPATTVVKPSSGRRWADRPTPQTEATTPLGAPPPVPEPAGPFEVLRNQRVGTGPVTWDPCRPIRYVVEATGGPPEATQILDEALAKVSAATGLRFEDGGTTDEGYVKDRLPFQPERYGDRWAPVLILWTTPETVPDLGGHVLGVSGPIAVSDRDGSMVYVTGTVALDAPDLVDMLAERRGAESVRAVVQHELGHLVGLDHVADPDQLMYTETGPRGPTDWGNGDLAGLNLLGRGACHPSL